MFDARQTALYAAISTMLFVSAEASARYVTTCGSVSGRTVCTTKWVAGSEKCHVEIDPFGYGGEVPLSATCTVKGSTFQANSEGPDYSCNGNNLYGLQVCSGTPTAGPRAPKPLPSSCLNNKYGRNPACGRPNFDGNDLTASASFVDIGSGLWAADAEITTGTGGGTPTCSNGAELTNFTATEFIGIVDVTFPSEVYDFTTFQHCVLQPIGGQYDCTNIDNEIDLDSCGYGGSGSGSG